MIQISESWVKKISYGVSRSIAYFYCEYCNSFHLKRIDNGNESKSCGCNKNAHKIKHGDCIGYKQTSIYGIWRGMKRRCYSKDEKRYKNYGGRGIAVCNEWLSSFESFRDWAMLNGYDRSLQIDRRDNDGNYEPSNCRFITLANNNRNKTNTKLSMEKAEQIRSMYKTGDYSQRALGAIFDVPQGTIWKVLKNIAWYDKPVSV